MGVYPQSGLPVEVEIAPGANLSADPGTWPWVDVTADWRIRHGITISEGRSDWGEYVDAGSIALVIDNRSGNYSQYNSAGIWYGLLGRDTPLRVRLRRGQDAFGRTVAGGIGTADSGQAYTNSGGAAGDYSVVPGTARHSLASVNVSRNSLLGVGLVDVTVAATVTVPVLASGAAIYAGVVARWDDSSGSRNGYLCELLTETSNAVALQLRKYVAGAVSTIVAATTITGLTHAAGTTYNMEFRCVGDQLQARVWDAAGAKPAVWHVQGTDTTHAGRAGAAGFRSLLGSGNTNTLPVVLSWSALSVVVDLAGGYVPAWVPRWDKSSHDRWVEVTAKGTLYRVQPGTGKAPKQSPLRRTITHRSLAYWPMEEGDSATVAGSAFAGHPQLAATGNLTFAQVTNVISGEIDPGLGTGRLANLAGGAQLSATVPPSVTAATASGWTVAAGWQLFDVNAITGDLVLLEVETPDAAFVRWQLIYRAAPFGITVLAYDAAGAATQVFTPVSVTQSFQIFNLSVWQSSAGVISVGWRYFHPTFGPFGGFEAGGTVSGTLTGPTKINVNTHRATSTLALPYGHLSVFAEHPLPDGIDTHFDLDGYLSWPLTYDTAEHSWRYEAAHERLARLLAEDGIPLDMPTVDAAGALRMGPQPTEAKLALYRDCEDVDGGVLFETPFGLGYQPRVARYNQTPALVLDGAGDLAEPPQLDPDNQGYRNRWTVTRKTGASAVVETPEVTAGTALVYDEAAELNLAVDDQPRNVAGWRLHLSTTPGARWPRLDLDLAASPHLIDAWLNCRIGARVQVTNPPADVRGQDIDVIVEGHTTTLGYKDWNVEANCSPAAPWDVATIDGPQRIVANGATLAAAVTAEAMSLSLAWPADNGRWTTDPAAFPLDLRVGGERVTVSAITGTTSPQTATVAARGVNGVQLAWPAGTPVDVWQPAIVGLTN